MDRRNPGTARRMHCCGGFTLFEALLASALLTVAVAAIAQSVSAGQQETYHSLNYLRGMALAESLMEEILSQPYSDPNGIVTPGPDSGETTRQLYTNIDDYHGFNEAAGSIKDAAGALYPTEYQGFTRGATAVYGTTTVTGLGAAVSGITVTVTVISSAGAPSWTITRFVSDPN